MIKARIDGRYLLYQLDTLPQKVVLRPGEEPEHWIVDIPAFTGLTMAEVGNVTELLAEVAKMQKILYRVGNPHYEEES